MKAMKAASVAVSTRQRRAASKSPKAKTKTVSSNALKLNQLFIRKLKALKIIRMRGAYTDVAPNSPGPRNAELQRALTHLEVGHSACEAMVKLSRSTLRRLRQVVSMTREDLREGPRMEILPERAWIQQTKNSEGFDRVIAGVPEAKIMWDSAVAKGRLIMNEYGEMGLPVLVRGKTQRRLPAGLTPSSCGPAGASPHTTGTSRTPLGVGSLDRPKDTPHRALHPHRCKARVGRDGGGVWR